MRDHTPIPWKVERNVHADGIIHLAVVDSRGNMICSVSPMEWVRYHDEANADLISAAPEMIYALELAKAKLV